MKFNKSTLLLIILVLALINIVLFSIDKGVSDENVQVRFMFITKTENENEYSNFLTMLSKYTTEDPKITFQYIGPSKASSTMEEYNINGAKAFVIVANGRVLYKSSGFPTEDKLEQLYKKYD